MLNFIVLASGRSGSTMLVNYLSSHSIVRCHHEPFRQRGWHPDLQSYDNALDALNHITYEGLSISNYRRVVSYAQSVLGKCTGDTIVEPWKVLPKDGIEGFKMTWAHADKMWPEFTQWLESQNRLKVILLTRQNVLARYVSYELAERSGLWHSSSPSNALNRLHVDPEKFNLFTELQEQQKQSMTELLLQTNCEFLDITYEELVGAPEDSMHGVFDFLGTIPSQKLLQTTAKLINAPLRDVIINYTELEQQGSHQKV